MPACPSCGRDPDDYLALEDLGDLLPDLLETLAAEMLGRKGGKRGGAERARRMTPEQRSAAASLAARVRWGRGKS